MTTGWLLEKKTVGMAQNVIEFGRGNKMKVMRKKITIVSIGILILTVLGAGCGMHGQADDDGVDGQETVQETQNGQDNIAETGMTADVDASATESADNGQSSADNDETSVLGESAADGHVDFAMLQSKNPDIFAWLYIPGTGIDMPLLQSHISDDHYKTHDVLDQENTVGALYTEMPNLMNMCDFNTIIHGNDLEEGAPFKELHLFEDADFFAEHEEFYIYMPDNALTYEIFVAYYDEGSDILRRYDYTTLDGCQTHLNDIYSLRSMNRNFREGWEGLTPYHFLVTLDGIVREDNTQYVVIGALKEDAAGKIDRMIFE